MHPLQQEFVAAFKAWDSEQMAQALIRLIEAFGEVTCGETTRQDILWTCREFLDDIELHPTNGYTLTFPEIQAEFDLYSGVQMSNAPTLLRHSKILLKFSISADASERLRKRWQEMGFVEEELRLARGEVRTPAPLKGEPGYPDYDPNQPSIHRRKGVLAAPEAQTYAYALTVDAGESSPLLRRYRTGEQEAVWRELLALGERVREADILPDAVAVVRETMRRCRQNVERLVERLRAIGYAFKEPDAAITPPGPDVLDRIAEIEARVGPMPLALCAWYEIVGRVNLVGSHSRLPSSHPAYPDPLVVLPADYVLKYHEENWLRERYSLDIAPDDFFKANFSGGPAYKIVLPDARADAPLEYEWHKTTFVDYLRHCFRWGGFPGMARLLNPALPQAFLNELEAELLPI